MQRILIIRRDNIGDLVCTTPMIDQLRQQFPQARIDALVNSYNRPVLDGHPALNQIFEYTKGKHRHAGQNLLSIYWGKLKLFWTLRRAHYDLAVLPSSGFNRRGLSFARMVGARRILGYINQDVQKISGLTDFVDIRQFPRLHEAEYCSTLLQPLGIQQSPPPARVFVSNAEIESARSRAGLSVEDLQRGVVGLHISARKPSNRWREDQFVALIQRLWQREQKPILLFWSPGPANHPQHPGDDELAERLLSACNGVRLIPFATQHLRELIGGVALCETLICSDGGAMHIGAGLGKPIVCLFGDSDATHWRPWGVPHRVLQTPDRQASSVSVETLLQAYEDLRASLPASSLVNS